jgi:hypothetical protein
VKRILATLLLLALPCYGQEVVDGGAPTDGGAFTYDCDAKFPVAPEDRAVRADGGWWISKPRADHLTCLNLSYQHEVANLRTHYDDPKVVTVASPGWKIWVITVGAALLGGAIGGWALHNELSQ